LLEFKVTNSLVLFVRVSCIRDECALNLVHGEERVELVKYGLHVLIIDLVRSYNIPCYFHMCVLLTLLRLGLLLLFSLGLITVIVVIIFDLIFITVVVAVVIINRIFDYLAHGLVS
jgi:hypothetical protein